MDKKLIKKHTVDFAGLAYWGVSEGGESLRYALSKPVLSASVCLYVAMK